MGQINLTQSLTKLRSFIEIYNGQFDEKDLKSRLRGNIVATAERLLKVLNHCSMKGLSNKNTFKTNNEAISTLTLFSARTIIRHIKKLEEANVITSRTSNTGNGKYHFNYTVEINPDIVVFKDSTVANAVDNSKKNVDNSKNDVENTPFYKSLDPKAQEGLKAVIQREIRPFSSFLKNQFDTHCSSGTSRTSRTTRTYSGNLIEKIPGIELLRNLKVTGSRFFSKLEPVENLVWNVWNRFSGDLAAKVERKILVKFKHLEQFFRGARAQKNPPWPGKANFYKILTVFSRDPSIVAPLQSYLQQLKYAFLINSQHNFYKT